MKVNLFLVIISFVSFIAHTGKAQEKSPISFSAFLVNSKEVKSLIQLDDDSLKLEAIRFLLQMKGNTYINLVWFGYTDPDIQREYSASISTKHPNFSYATNQLVALYLITAIYHSDLQFCNRVEVTYENNKGDKVVTTNLEGKCCYENRWEEKKNWKIVEKPYFYYKLNKRRYQHYKFKIVDREIIKKMFSYYESWFSELERKGFDKVSAPLVNTSIKWN